MTAVDAPAKTGNGAAISWTSAPYNTFAGKVIRIDGLSEALEALDWSDLSTTTQQKLIASDLKVMDPLEIEWRWSGHATQGYGSVDPVETSANITITMPVWSSTGVTGTKIIGSGFVLSCTSPTLENNVVGTGTFMWQMDGITAVTVTPEDTT